MTNNNDVLINLTQTLPNVVIYNRQYNDELLLQLFAIF